MTSDTKKTFASTFKTSFGGGFSSAFPGSLAGAVTVGPIARPVGAIRYLSSADFEARFACRINSLPQNVCLIGWDDAEGSVYCAPLSFSGIRGTHASFLFHHRRNETLLKLIVNEVVRPLKLGTIWFAYCFYDGWRERNLFSTDYRFVTPPDLSAEPEWRGEPGDIPILSPDRHWIGCLGAHRGDPSALLLPDSHYLADRYVPMFAEVAAASLPWRERQARAVFAAGDHGESRNLAQPLPDATIHPRRLFKQTVQREGLAVDVYLGERLDRAAQMRYRYIADVDGFARTWDAWAWKMMSGSVVLAVDSIWDSFFSQCFTPWQHYVPVANDCSDLAARLDWCRDNDAECQAIATRARERATVVYNDSFVVQRLRETFAARLGGGAAAQPFAAAAR